MELIIIKLNYLFLKNDNEGSQVKIISYDIKFNFK